MYSSLSESINYYSSLLGFLNKIKAIAANTAIPIVTHTFKSMIISPF